MKSNISSKQVVRNRLDKRENYLCRSWMYQLRENNKTKRIYDVDPFVEVYRLRDNLYALLTDLLDGEGGYVWMYLIVGPEKALLVDTSFGLGDLKGLVAEISGDKPVIVVNTHCSCDHSYGNCQFDNAYGHMDLVDDMNWKQDPGIWDYLFDESGESIWNDFERGDLISFKKYEFTGVPDGHVFNLGEDYDIELVWLPGHQPGHAGYLDRKGRVLIAGDAICGGGVSLSGGSDFHADARHARDKFQGSTIPTEDRRRTVTAYRDSLVRLSGRLGEFDYVFGGHDVNDIDSGVILNIIDACDDIIAHPDIYDSKDGDRLSKIVPGWGVIMYYAGGI
jgi:glyoxylase-like metal-dependent hydrolase (beta-lactamase superfamily II)